MITRIALNFIKNKQLFKQFDSTNTISVFKHPFNIQNIQNISNNPIKINSNIVFFTGNNGSGKTTLLEGIAVNMGLNQYGGSSNFILEENEDIFNNKLVISKNNNIEDLFFFRAETFFNLQKEIEKYGSDLTRQYTGGDKNFRQLSHGEGFKAFFENRIRKNGVYFFDEPEAALSIQNQIELLFILKEFEKLGCQFFISTHSPVLLSYPGSQIFSFDSDIIKEIDYEETNAYCETKNFLENYKRFQKEINNSD